MKTLEHITDINENFVLDQPITKKNSLTNPEFQKLLDDLESSISFYKQQRIVKNSYQGDNTNEILPKIKSYQDDNTNVVLPKIKITRELDSKNYIAKSQKWKGNITDIDKSNKIFTAKLYDLNNPTTYEEGEFEFKEVTDDDKELIRPGAAFYWSIGQGVTNGSIEGKSILRFQRLANWTTTETDEAFDRADAWFNMLPKED